MTEYELDKYRRSSRLVVQEFNERGFPFTADQIFRATLRYKNYIASKPREETICIGGMAVKCVVREPEPQTHHSWAITFKNL